MKNPFSWYAKISEKLLFFTLEYAHKRKCQVWRGRRKTDFMKKHATATGTSVRLPVEHATGDHSKQLRPCLYVVQNY